MLTVDDQDDIKAIAAEAKKNQYGVKDIVRAVACPTMITAKTQHSNACPPSTRNQEPRTKNKI